MISDKRPPPPSGTPEENLARNENDFLILETLSLRVKRSNPVNKKVRHSARLYYYLDSDGHRPQNLSILRGPDKPRNDGG
ncbi:MAG: hypothetical protein Q4E56_05175, partial [Pseudomonadota bacterium]|nr:hypothetical protein [Pseudomonadota bacterium]